MKILTFYGLSRDGSMSGIPVQRRVLYGIGRSVCLLFLCALCQETAAESIPRLGVGPFYRLGSDETAIVVEAPRDLSKMNASGFKLLLAGEEVATAYDKKAFAQSGKELAWMLCIDVTDRVPAQRLNDTKGALRTFVANSQSLRVGLMTVGARIQPVQGFLGSDRREALARTIDGLKTDRPGSKTRLDQVLTIALDDYEKAMAGLPERRRILVIWGGKDETSGNSLDQIVGRANALGIRIDVVALGKIERQYRDLLNDLADRTGGLHRYALQGVVTPKDALNQIYRQVMETHAAVVYFKYRPDAIAGKALEIELQQPNAAPLKGAMFLPIAQPEPTIPPIAASPDGQGSSSPNAVRRPVPYKLPAVPEEPAAADDSKWRHLALAAGLAAILSAGIVVIGRRIMVVDKSRPGPENSSRKTPIVAKPEAPRPSHRLTESMPEPRRLTTVGGEFPPPRSWNPAAVLDGIGGVAQGKRFYVDKEVFRLGADTSNDLPILGDAYVSTHHAYLSYERGNLFIVDVGSRNGTFVNGERVSGTTRVLVPGDQIRIGNCTFIVAIAARI